MQFLSHNECNAKTILNPSGVFPRTLQGNFCVLRGGYRQMKEVKAVKGTIAN